MPPRQGLDALDPAANASCAAADVGIASIGGLVDQDIGPLLGGRRSQGSGQRTPVWPM